MRALSLDQQTASRANGARARGPKTAPGKPKFSVNAYRQGLPFHRYKSRLHSIVQRSLARTLTTLETGVPNEPENLLNTNDLLDSQNPSEAGL